ncbi:DMT family transporter [Actinomadura sp. SCN-SB]|uniref:DMT family transporter n=1 Tax=Actinomadura sp. SCN-SB TaxID=3373092 RepID=UPI0037501B00
MRDEDSATELMPIALGGPALAGLGVLIFSWTIPASVLALDGLDPYLVGVGRAAVAAILAALALAAVRARRPRRGQWGRLAVISGGVVFGFPVLTTLALDLGASGAHSAVVVGLLPATTAVFAVLRAGERPSAAFWAASAAGAVVVTGFTLIRSGGHVTGADLLLFGALLAAAAGYTEGARMTREMPGWRVISWATVAGAPISVPVAAWLLATTGPEWTGRSVFGIGYVSALSAYLGFFAWYEGLARTGIARGGQIQLAQPLLTIVWSGIALGELIDGTTALAAVLVLICVLVTQRARVQRVQDVPGRVEARAV